MPVTAPPRPTDPARAPSSSAPARSAAAGRREGQALRVPGEGRIRWDRVGRVALLALLAVVLALYVAPLKQWFAQTRAAEEQRRDLRALELEHDRLLARSRELRQEPALEREARRYGMVRRGERPFVVQGEAARP